MLVFLPCRGQLSTFPPPLGVSGEQGSGADGVVLASRAREEAVALPLSLSHEERATREEEKNEGKKSRGEEVDAHKHRWPLSRSCRASSRRRRSSPLLSLFLIMSYQVRVRLLVQRAVRAEGGNGRAGAENEARICSQRCSHLVPKTMPHSFFFFFLSFLFLHSPKTGRRPRARDAPRARVGRGGGKQKKKRWWTK